MTKLNRASAATIAHPHAARRGLLELLAMTAICLAVLPAGSAFAGRLFATGHDIDLHCSGGSQCGYVRSAVNYLRGGAPDPNKPVLVLERLDLDFSAALTNTFGLGVVPTVSMDPRSAEFTTAPLNTGLYSAILIGSDTTCGGCDLNEFDTTPDSDAINARAADIRAFFNQGGGLLYGSGGEHGNGTDPDDVYYQSAPLPLGGVAVAEPFTLTPEGTALGLTDEDANCCATHNSFVNPPAGSTIVVLERDSAGSAETLSSEGTISTGGIFTLTLSPGAAQTATGTAHTVTATLNNQLGAAAARSVLFTVSGANPGSGAVVTNGSGQAAFTYTGTSPGDDAISACADLDGNGACSADEPTATASKSWVGAAIDTTPPLVTIIGGPTTNTGQVVSAFTFASNEPGVTFECRIDSAPFAPCVSPFRLPAGLKPGTHTFEVRARDAAGNVGPVATRVFTLADKDGDGIPDALDTSDASVGPTLAKTVVAKVVSGTVLVKYPAGFRPRSAPTASGFVPLKGAEILPIGTQVDSRRGRLALTSVASGTGAARKTQTADFYKGIFQIKQARATKPVTELVLSSSAVKKQCGSSSKGASAASAKSRSSKKVVSQLWGNGKGNFRTRGRNSTATVRGTIWLTQERCDGTFTRVQQGRVTVRDLRAGRTITVRAGRGYLARAARAAAKRKGGG